MLVVRTRQGTKLVSVAEWDSHPGLGEAHGFNQELKLLTGF